MEFISPIANEEALIKKLKDFFINSICQVERYPDKPEEYSLLSPAAVLTHTRGSEASESITSLVETLQVQKNNLDLMIIAKKLHPTGAERADAILSLIEDIVNGRRDDKGIVREKGLRGFKLPDGSSLVYRGYKFQLEIQGEWWYEVYFEAETGLE